MQAIITALALKKGRSAVGGGEGTLTFFSLLQKICVDRGIFRHDQCLWQASTQAKKSGHNPATQFFLMEPRGWGGGGVLFEPSRGIRRIFLATGVFSNWMQAVRPRQPWLWHLYPSSKKVVPSFHTQNRGILVHHRCLWQASEQKQKQKKEPKGWVPEPAEHPHAYAPVTKCGLSTVHSENGRRECNHLASFFTINLWLMSGPFSGPPSLSQEWIHGVTANLSITINLHWWLRDCIYCIIFRMRIPRYIILIK